MTKKENAEISTDFWLKHQINIIRENSMFLLNNTQKTRLKKSNPFLTDTKINLRWIIDLNV